ncbi:MAG: ferritin-like domain-containing protein [Planctomycetota bacterium]
MSETTRGEPSRTTLIQLLNQALQNEYTDVFLYPREADALKEKELSALFERFGRMELRHADNLAMQIMALGETPVWEFSVIDIPKTLDEILSGHIKREKEAIHLYEQLLTLCNRDKQDQLKIILAGLKAEEEVHFQTIKAILDKKQNR